MQDTDLSGVTNRDYATPTLLPFRGSMIVPRTHKETQGPVSRDSWCIEGAGDILLSNISIS